MNFKTTSWIALLVLLCAPHCAKKDSGTPSNTVPTNPPVGTVDNAAGFYARVIQVANINMPIHSGDTTMTTSCVAAQGQQLDCYIESEELDLFAQGLTLQYNVPSSLCAYTYFMPYYYYAYQPGAGPSIVQIDTDQNGSVGIDTDNNGTINGPATTTCQYDYTPSLGPNCCTGKYSSVNRTWNATATPPGYTSATATGIPWGGDLSTCIDGPAVGSQQKNKANFPIPTITDTFAAGANYSYEITAPIKKLKASNVYAANYFNPAQHGGGKPTAVVQPYYDLQCLDRSFELQAQIRIQIREWNTEADFNNRIAVPGAFDVTGPESAPFGAFPLNDLKDWGDYLNAYPNGSD